MKIIQVSDLHLVEPGRTLFGSDPLARLDACLADIDRRHPDAELIAITGDLTDEGEPAVYAALRDRLSAVKTDVRLVVGNHDDRSAFREAFGDAPMDESGFVQSVRDTARGRLLFLDTLAPGLPEGHYCADRRNWLKMRLAEARGRPVFIFMHHPPMKLGMPSMDVFRLRDADAFYDVIREHGDIRHIFFGHVHRPVSGTWRGIPFSAVKGTNHQVLLDFSETAELRASAEPPSYAVILMEQDGVTVHFHDFLEPQAAVEAGTL